MTTQKPLGFVWTVSSTFAPPVWRPTKESNSPENTQSDRRKKHHKVCWCHSFSFVKTRFFLWQMKRTCSKSMLETFSADNFFHPCTPHEEPSLVFQRSTECQLRGPCSVTSTSKSLWSCSVRPVTCWPVGTANLSSTRTTSTTMICNIALQIFTLRLYNSVQLCDFIHV